MLRILEKPIIAVPLLLVLAIYLYFFQLDKIALTDPDETFYAQTAKEMFKKGEWLTLAAWKEEKKLDFGPIWRANPWRGVQPGYPAFGRA